MSKKDEIIDATGMKFIQLNKDNEDFLKDKDFVDPKTGQWRELTAKVVAVTREWLLPPGKSKDEDKNLVNLFRFENTKKRWATTAAINNAGLKSHFGENVIDCVGHKITLRYDPTVKAFGKVTGGIRIKWKGES